MFNRIRFELKVDRKRMYTISVPNFKCNSNSVSILYKD